MLHFIRERGVTFSFVVVAEVCQEVLKHNEHNLLLKLYNVQHFKQTQAYQCFASLVFI